MGKPHPAVLTTCLNLTKRSSPEDTITVALNGYWSMAFEKFSRMVYHERPTGRNADAAVTLGVAMIGKFTANVDETFDLVAVDKDWPDEVKDLFKERVSRRFHADVQFI